MFPKVSLSKVFSFTGLKQSRVFSFLRMKAPLAKDTVEISRKIPQTVAETVAEYAKTKDIPFDNLFTNEHCKRAYEIVKKARNGDEESVKLLEQVKAVSDSTEKYCDINFNDRALDILAGYYRHRCRAHSNKPIEFSPLEYHRIFRTIGESEYNALLKGEHIVSKIRGTGVDVTNSPKGVGAVTRGTRYFVSYKDKDNFDPLLNGLLNYRENYIPHVDGKNNEMAQYVLEGGYNLKDVEIIKELESGKLVYSSKS